MTNEITKVELTASTGFPRRYTVASGTAITKGSLLQFSDPRTAIQATTITQIPIAGITSMAKSGTDYSTSVTVWTNGVFDVVASGSITTGSPVFSASDANYPNTVATAAGLAPPASGAAIIGYALEDATDAERIAVRVTL